MAGTKTPTRLEQAKQTNHEAGEARAVSARLAKIFEALSDPIRLDIVAKLYREGECTCNQLNCCSRPKSTMTHHFRVLREAGLVQTRTCGVTHVNSLCRAEVDAAFPGLLEAVITAAGR